MVEKTMTDEILSFYQERIKNLQTALSDIIDTADLDNQIISDPIQYAEKLKECVKQAKEVLSDKTVKSKKSFFLFNQYGLFYPEYVIMEELKERLKELKNNAVVSVTISSYEM